MRYILIAAIIAVGLQATVLSNEVCYKIYHDLDYYQERLDTTTSWIEDGVHLDSQDPEQSLRVFRELQTRSAYQVERLTRLAGHCDAK